MELGRLDRVLLAARHATAARALAALAAMSALAPFPAAAQAVATSQARLEILDPVTAGIAGDMYFGDITPAGINGTVVMAPGASATCTTTGGLIRTGICQAAKFTGTAAYQSVLRVRRPIGDRIDLTGPGGATMRLDDFVFAATAPTVFLSALGANTRFRIDDPTGEYTFYAGATLHVAGNQAPGTYTGTFEINVAYN